MHDCQNFRHSRISGGEGLLVHTGGAGPAKAKHEDLHRCRPLCSAFINPAMIFDLSCAGCTPSPLTTFQHLSDGIARRDWKQERRDEL